MKRIERELRDEELSGDQFARRRRKRVEPEFERFHAWLTKKGEEVVPSTLLGKAVGYTLGEWEKLVRYLERAELSPDTNEVERAIRPFVIGRNNRRFSASPGGAASSCALYSLVKSARQNNLNPYAYLYYLFNRVPHITSDQEWDELLPHAVDREAVNRRFFAPVG